MWFYHEATFYPAESMLSDFWLQKTIVKREGGKRQPF